mmetsp:Transcript_3736/g.13231  ORF Transcript_3736/g.13231 Transcript_3736/m.13231 type:complete len:110 (+) Transcript_3736:325-654(+)
MAVDIPNIANLPLMSSGAGPEKLMRSENAGLPVTFASFLEVLFPARATMRAAFPLEAVLDVFLVAMKGLDRDAFIIVVAIVCCCFASVMRWEICEGEAGVFVPSGLSCF